MFSCFYDARHTLASLEYQFETISPPKPPKAKSQISIKHFGPSVQFVLFNKVLNEEINKTHGIRDHVS